MKRGRIRNLISYGAIGVSSLFGARCGTGPVLPISIPVDLDDIIDTYTGVEINPPPLGDSVFAVKVYTHSKNNLNSPDNLLGATDGNYTTFECSKNSPLEIVVGFTKEFSAVMPGWRSRWPRWHVEGGAANPLILAGLPGTEIPRFFFDYDRTKSDIAILPYGSPSDHPGWGGGIFTIDTGPGRSRFFMITAYPIGNISDDLPNDTTREIYIDSFHLSK